MSCYEVLVVVLAGDGWIRLEVTKSLLAIARDSRYAVEVRVLQAAPVSSARNTARRLAIEGGFDYLVMIDDDNPPPANVLDLCGMGLDVVGAPTPIWCPKSPGERPWYFNALVCDDRRDALEQSGSEYGWRPVQDVHHPIKVGELLEVDALGGGCLVLSRRALLAVDAPFRETFNDWGEILTSEDYEACRHWKAAGLRIFAHFGYLCGHVKELELSHVLRSTGMVALRADPRLSERGPEQGLEGLEAKAVRSTEA